MFAMLKRSIRCFNVFNVCMCSSVCASWLIRSFFLMPLYFGKVKFNFLCSRNDENVFNQTNGHNSLAAEFKMDIDIASWLSNFHSSVHVCRNKRKTKQSGRTMLSLLLLNWNKWFFYRLIIFKQYFVGCNIRSVIFARHFRSIFFFATFFL